MCIFYKHTHTPLFIVCKCICSCQNASTPAHSQGGKGFLFTYFNLPFLLKGTSLYILEKYIGEEALTELGSLCKEWETELMDGWLNEYKWTDTFTGK